MMAVRTVDRKKRIEAHYLEEARRASALFPAGELVPHERPDFLTPTRTIGIEVTELCREAPRAEAGRLGKVHEKARARYMQRSGAIPVDVSLAFSHRAEELTVGELADSLADFVYQHRHDDKGFRDDLPDGYCHIGVFPPLERSPDLGEPQTPGRWLYFSAGDTVLVPRELIESRIAEKNRRVPDYRKAARKRGSSLSTTCFWDRVKSARARRI